MKLLMNILLVGLLAQSPALNFEEVKEKAKELEQPILIVFSGSDWCANCIKLKNDVLDQPEFKEFQQDNFQLYTADFPRKRTEVKSYYQQNEALADQYNPEGKFPFLVLIDAEGNVLKESTGKFKETEAIKSWLGY